MVSAKEYYENVLKQAGVSDTKRQALITQLDDEEISKALANEQVVPRMRHDEYSREMDKLKAKDKQTTDYYQSLLNWKAEQDRMLAADPVIQPTNGEYLTKKELDDLKKTFTEELGKQSANQITITKMMGRLASQHVVEFKEALDVDALERVAIEKNLPLPQAYVEMVASRRATQTETQRKAELDAARAEGAREFASKHKIPVDTGAREPEFGRLNFARDPKQAGIEDYVPNSGRLSPSSENKLRESFVNEWDKAPAANTSGT